MLTEAPVMIHFDAQMSSSSVFTSGSLNVLLQKDRQYLTLHFLVQSPKQNHKKIHVLTQLWKTEAKRN